MNRKKRGFPHASDITSCFIVNRILTLGFFFFFSFFFFFCTLATIFPHPAGKCHYYHIMGKLQRTGKKRGFLHASDITSCFIVTRILTLFFFLSFSPFFFFALSQQDFHIRQGNVTTIIYNVIYY